MNYSVYIDLKIPSCNDLKNLLRSSGYSVCTKEEDATIFIRYSELTSETDDSPFAIYVQKCEANKFEKTIFFGYSDFLKSYPNFANYFHPKNTAGKERLYLFDEKYCFHLILPWDSETLLGTLKKLI